MSDDPITAYREEKAKRADRVTPGIAAAERIQQREDAAREHRRKNKRAGQPTTALPSDPANRLADSLGVFHASRGHRGAR